MSLWMNESRFLGKEWIGGWADDAFEYLWEEKPSHYVALFRGRSGLFGDSAWNSEAAFYLGNNCEVDCRS